MLNAFQMLGEASFLCNTIPVIYMLYILAYQTLCGFCFWLFLGKWPIIFQFIVSEKPVKVRFCFLSLRHPFGSCKVFVLYCTHIFLNPSTTHSITSREVLHKMLQIKVFKNCFVNYFYYITKFTSMNSVVTRDLDTQRQVRRLYMMIVQTLGWSLLKRIHNVSLGGVNKKENGA